MAGSVLDQFKNQYKYGGAYIRLLIWNVIFTASIWLIEAFSGLFKSKETVELFVGQHLIAHSDPIILLKNPWSAFTSMFMHGDFFHLLFNMFMLYFAGRLLQHIIGERRIYFMYFIGGLAALLLHVLAINIFPIYNGLDIPILGASGAVTAVFIALATLRPHLETLFFGVLKVKIVYLAIFFIAIDVFSVSANDGVAHFAHIGGALFGFLWARSYSKGKDWSSWFKFSGFKNMFKKKPKLRVVKNARNTTADSKIDDDYREQKASRQQSIDAILDKIKDSGYDSLTKKEKDFLFRESKKL